MTKITTKASRIRKIQEFIEQLSQKDDTILIPITTDEGQLNLFLIDSITSYQYIQRDILPNIPKQFDSLEDVRDSLPVYDQFITDHLDLIKEKLFRGYVMIYQDHNPNEFLLVCATRTTERNVSLPEVEFSVVGPKEAFVESISTNLNLIRKRLPIPELQVEMMKVGEFTKTKIAIVYIEGIASEKNVQTLRERLKKVKYDHIIDSSYLVQFITDNRNSPFPQIIDTERPDRVTAVLSEGKIGILIDGSPQVLTCPTSAIEFFGSFEDYFINWILATFFRFIRFFAVFFSALSTPAYVAILTYHYQMIPIDLLATLTSSRADIPFPPIFEATILELAIELLREAGARLPTKVGQTIGIVGGIVIGTASVEAGLTSNVLLIIVAVAALASFTTPIYQMSNTIRFIRFPFLLFAQLYGLVGISLGITLLLAHLLRLRSLGNPYLAPLFPTQVEGYKDALIRLPFRLQRYRPVENLPKKKSRIFTALKKRRR